MDYIDEKHYAVQPSVCFPDGKVINLQAEIALGTEVKAAMTRFLDSTNGMPEDGMSVFELPNGSGLFLVPPQLISQCYIRLDVYLDPYTSGKYNELLARWSP